MTDRIETVILSNLINDEDFCRKVLPFIDVNYFSERSDKTLFSDIESFFGKYNKPPNQQILKIHLEDRTDLKQSEFDKTSELIDELTIKESNSSWLIERTEKFCKDQSLYNAIMESISILDGKDTKFTKEAIPSLLQDALAVSFDKTVGHDYFMEADKRFDSYHLKEDRVPFGLNIFNKITKGGLPKKTLSVILSGTNVGKSLFMCDFSAKLIEQGKNVLYISLEMSETRIAERVDCNLLDITIDDLYRVKKNAFSAKMQDLKNKSYGTFIVKEFPTASAHVGHFKSLLDELKTKKNFVPDAICIDYINICCSQRVKNTSANSYTIVKSIAEEIRGLAVEYDVPILSATQGNREAQTSTDLDLTNTSESIGLPQTVDFMFSMVRTEELDQMGQIMVKQLKSRFNDVNYYKRFVIGVDISKFKLYDVDQPGANIADSGRTDSIKKSDTSNELDFS